MPPVQEANPVVRTLSRYLDSLFDRLAERLAPKVADELGLWEDLREADSEPDEAAVPYEEIRRDLGLAETQPQARR